MAKALTIGAVARRSGVPARTIRFYEDEGIIPPPSRSEAGYRLYGDNDLRRLRLVRRARLLGLSLPAVKALVARAFASDCADYAEDLLIRVAEQRAGVDRRIAELIALRADLDALEQHLRHARASVEPGRRVETCGFCPLIDDQEL